MHVLLPVDSCDASKASLTKINDAKFWAQLLIREGRVSKMNFSVDRECFEDFSEAVVVVDDGEYVWPFMEQSMMVLVAHTQRSIDDIVEAYLFKELNELAY